MLLRGIDEGATRVVVDLAKVTFIDSTALGVVVGGVKGVRAHGGSLDMVCDDENIRRIFEITGLDRILGMYRSRQEALGAATGEAARHRPPAHRRARRSPAPPLAGLLGLC